MTSQSEEKKVFFILLFIAVFTFKMTCKFSKPQHTLMSAKGYFGFLEGETCFPKMDVNWLTFLVLFQKENVSSKSVYFQFSHFWCLGQKSRFLRRTIISQDENESEITRQQ
ncbi:hypothetical protein Droror1_Dr00007590 [Drosera rotundifolia]